MNWKWLAIPGAIFAGLGIWTALGFPTIATGMDIKRLDKKSIVLEQRNRKLERNFLLSLPPPADPSRKAILQQQIMDLQDEIKVLKRRENQLR